MATKYLCRKLGLLPVTPRDPLEAHRVATPLELLFDLVSVIAIASAAAGLHHAISSSHLVEGLLKFAAAFFAIWWAWMNFTWYASAYDNDDDLHRFLTMVAITGSLIMAAGIYRFFATSDIDAIVLGFVIMRLAMVCLWLRAAKADSDRRLTAIRYAAGISLVQIYWLGLMLAQPLPGYVMVTFYVIGALSELAVPAYAESYNATTWHHHHLIERYGLMNIIVLGETLLASELAFQRVDSSNIGYELIRVAISSLVIVFALWRVYFSKEEQICQKRSSLAWLWGYGHLLIYMAGASVGAGIATLVDSISSHSETLEQVALYCVGIAISGYLFGLWAVRDQFVMTGLKRHTLLLLSILIVLAPLLVPLEGVAILLVVGVVVRNIKAHKSVENEVQLKR